VFDGFSRENAAIRDAARQLSGRRDAKVVQETFENLLTEGHLSLEAEAAERIRAVLRSASHGPEADEDVLAGFIRQFEPLRERIPRWQIDGHGFGVVEDGLEATYRQLREGMIQARRTRSAEDLHEWRKAAKYHWHHVTLLERAAPDVLAASLETLDALGERLGDHHNVHVLAEKIEDADLPASLAEPVLTAMSRRQDDLAKAAFALGSQLTAERPGALRDRFAAYWQLLRED
jgi:CHAD domain-containing protein